MKVLTFIFLFYSASGSFPLDILGVKSVNAYAIFFFMAVFLGMPRNTTRPLTLFPTWLCTTLLSMVFLVSSVWAENPIFAINRAAIVSGYMYLTIALPVLCHAKHINLNHLYGWAGITASLLLIASYGTITPLGFRATFPLVTISPFSVEALDDYELNDPNIVACALCAAFICLRQSFPKTSPRRYGSAVILLAVVLTQSRTALLFLPLCALIAGGITRSLPLRDTLRFLFLTILGLSLLVYLIYTLELDFIADALNQRLSNDSASNLDRLERLNLFASTIQDPFVILFGIGAGGSIDSGIEPHNMFMSFLLECGVFGLALFVLIFYFSGQFIKKSHTSSDRFYGIWLLLFIAASCLTYWHTRTLWISMAFSLFCALSGKKTKNNPS